MVDFVILRLYGPWRARIDRVLEARRFGTRE